MATKTDLQLLLTKGTLSSLWENKTIKTPPTTGSTAIHNGQIYIGLDSTDQRAMLFIDDGGKRHVLTADIEWDDIRNIPTDIVYQDAFEEHIETAENTYVKKAGDTMTGPLGIAASATTGAPKVQLLYNDDTQSLDFMFT